jgi:hypothetical protein
LNDADHAYWTAYARTLADGIGLKDWETVIRHDTPDDSNAAAAMITITGRRIVWIKLGNGFFADTPENQRHYMLHELVHVHTDDIDTAIWQAKDVITSDAFTLLEKVVKDRIEFATDVIASSVGHAFPLPPERAVT